MHRETLIIDGYNLLNAWRELLDLAEESLEHARERMSEHILDYAAYTGKKAILVFDAHLVKGGTEVRTETGPLMTIYTREGQTADSRIEKLSLELKSQGTIRVITSDRDEQDTIWAQGALRSPTREFLRELIAAEQKRLKEIAGLDGIKMRLEVRLEPGVRDELEKLRRRR